MAKTRLTLWTIAAVLALPAVGQAVDPMTRFGDDTVIGGLTDADWRMHPDPDEPMAWQEAWFTVLQLDSGEVLFISFLVTNLGVTSGSAGVEVSLTKAGAKERFFKGKYDKDALVQDPTGFGLTIEGNRYARRADGSLQLRVREEGLDLDVVLREPTVGFRPGGGEIFFGEKKKDYFYLWVHFIDAKLSGTMTVDGTARPVTGRAYMDHTTQNTPGSSISDRWHSLRLFTDDGALAMVEMIAHEDYGKAPLGWTAVSRGQQVIGVITNTAVTLGDVRKDEVTERSIPQTFALSASRDGLGVAGRYGPGTLLSRMMVLEHLSWFERTIVKTFVADPVFFRYVSPASFTVTLPDGSKRNMSGTGVHEVVTIDD